MAALEAVMEWFDDEVMDRLLGPESVADDLEAIGAELERVMSNARAARAALAEAAGLLREDMDAAGILFSGASATVPAARDDPDYEATLEAAAKLFASVFSEAPVLPGATGAAMDLVAAVYDAFLPSEPAGTLKDARKLVSTMADKHHAAAILFADCNPLLGIEAGDKAWEEWISSMARANAQFFKAEVRLQFAICEVQQAVLVHRLYRHPRLLRLIGGVRMREAWKLKEIVSSAIEEMDAALAAIGELRDAVATEERIVHRVLDAAAPQECTSM